jgi:hypothetical protein
MKTPSIALLDSLGFENDEQRVAYAAWVLRALSGNSKKVVISPAVRANPTATPPIVAAAEVSAPASTAIPGLTGAIEIERSSTEFHVVAKFPLPLNKQAIGAEIFSSDVGEIAGSTLQVATWSDTKASTTPTTSTTTEPPILERYFAKYAKTLIDGGLAGSSIDMGYLGTIPVMIFDLRLPVRSGYDPALQSLQLDKIGAAGGGGGGGYVS